MVGDKCQARAREIVQQLVAAGHSAFWVGGCVRDFLLGLVPKDYDVATSAHPEQVLALFPGSELVGAHFGVVLLPGGMEVATYRSEKNYEDGRHPGDVRFEKDPELDAARRDFTINALYYDPLREEVYDFTGGRKDLEQGIIRAIGDPPLRFREDHLRLLRAIRFAARFGYTIEPQTLEAMNQSAASIRRIAAERIHDEMRLILRGPNLDLVWQYLEKTTLWRQLVPQAPAGGRLARLRPPSSTALGWAALLEGHPSPQTVFEDYRFSQEERTHCRQLLETEPLLGSASGLPLPQLKRLVRGPLFREQMELHRATYGESPVWLYLLDRSSAWSHEELWPSPLLDGRDLIAQGLTPGPSFSTILERIENAQLAGEISTREEALKLAFA